jgi:hypothetical protein
MCDNKVARGCMIERGLRVHIHTPPIHTPHKDDSLCPCTLTALMRRGAKAANDRSYIEELSEQMSELGGMCSALAHCVKTLGTVCVAIELSAA